MLFLFSFLLAHLRSPFVRSGLLIALRMLYLLALTPFTKVYPLY